MPGGENKNARVTVPCYELTCAGVLLEKAFGSALLMDDGLRLDCVWPAGYERVCSQQHYCRRKTPVIKPLLVCVSITSYHPTPSAKPTLHDEVAPGDRPCLQNAKYAMVMRVDGSYFDLVRPITLHPTPSAKPNLHDSWARTLEYLG